jgi:hypothetical protein
MLGVEKFRWILLLEMFKQEKYGGQFTVTAFQYSTAFKSSRKGSEGGGPVTMQICKTLQRRPSVKYFRGVTFLVTWLTTWGAGGRNCNCGDKSRRYSTHMTPCSLSGRLQCFGRTCCLHLRSNHLFCTEYGGGTLLPVHRNTRRHIL